MYGDALSTLGHFDTDHLNFDFFYIWVIIFNWIGDFCEFNDDQVKFIDFNHALANQTAKLND